MPSKIRVEHAFQGTRHWCERCGHTRKYHRTRKRWIVGVDGEGHTVNGKHVYVYLAAVREDGRVIADAYNARGLTLDQCARVILAIGKHSIAFSFASTYDVTKVFEGLRDPFARFALFHPETRRRAGPRSAPYLRWKGRGYDVDGGSFAIAEGRQRSAHHPWRRSVKVWDATGFVRRSFLAALELHDVGTREQRLEIARMKQARGKKARPAELRDYCRLECELLARMMRKILDEIEGLGVDLKGRYRGVGSVTSALMRRHGVAARRGLETTNPELNDAVMRAYFAGRQELAVIGPVKEQLYEYDLASAYAWAMTSLPCLACGTWNYGAAGLPAAISLYRFNYARPLIGTADHLRRSLSWGPLPCRLDDYGGVVWGVNFTGWAWGAELDVARQIDPAPIGVGRGWAYLTPCDHKPFAFVEEVYEKRMRLVEAGQFGLAEILKHTLTACWGKTAQRAPSPFQSYVWAGLTTAIVRGRLLEVLDGDVLAVTTDAIVTRKQLPTGDGLGQWRLKGVYPRGLFFAGLGHYFERPGSAEDERLAAAYPRPVAVTRRHFFTGRETTVAMGWCQRCELSWDLRYAPLDCPGCGLTGLARAAVLPTYGTWGRQAKTLVFDPAPMRVVEAGRLAVRDLGGAHSAPFQPGSATLGACRRSPSPPT